MYLKQTKKLESAPGLARTLIDCKAEVRGCAGRRVGRGRVEGAGWRAGRVTSREHGAPRGTAWQSLRPPAATTA